MSSVVYPLAEPEKESLLFVTFSYGSGPTYVRYTDWDSDLVHPDNAQTYSSLTAMQVELPKMTGLFKESPAGLLLPANTFTLDLSSGEPWPEVTVRIEELTQDPDETIGRMLTLYVGTVRRTIRHYRGNPDSVNIEVENLKSAFTVPMGIIATHHCNWFFGSTAGCDPSGLDIAIDTLKETGTLTAINGHQVTITGLTSPRDLYWNRGHVEIDGLRILIREWTNAATTTFELVKSPPADWLNASVTVTPGCDKTVETCRLWANEEHFAGPGYAMPPYHPVLEIP
jgi:hypothetical protein